MSDIVDRLNEYQVFAKALPAPALRCWFRCSCRNHPPCADTAKARNEALRKRRWSPASVDLYRDGAGYHLDDSGRTRRNYANVAADADEQQ